MKYAKKMKLVDIDDTSQPCTQQSKLPTDDDFMAPRIFSTLDSFMNGILNRRDINDGEKWILYNQALQKYLSHMKSLRTKNSSAQLPTNHIQSDQNYSNVTPSPFNKNISDADITGIFPIRDSIDTISNPAVRSFFEQMRDSDGNNGGMSQLSPHQQSPLAINHSLDGELNRISPSHHNLPTTPEGIFNDDVSMRSLEKLLTTPDRNKAAPKRAAKRAALQDMSGAAPDKVRAQLYRTRNAPQSRYEFYWRTSNAK